MGIHSSIYNQPIQVYQPRSQNFYRKKNYFDFHCLILRFNSLGKMFRREIYLLKKRFLIKSVSANEFKTSFEVLSCSFKYEVATIMLEKAGNRYFSISKRNQINTPL